MLDDLIICEVSSHLTRSCWKNLRENEDFKKHTSFLLGFGAGHPVVVAYFVGYLRKTGPEIAADSLGCTLAPQCGHGLASFLSEGGMAHVR